MARTPILSLLLLLSSFDSFVTADLLTAADLPKLVSRHKLAEGEVVTVQNAKLRLRQAEDGILASTTSAAAAFIPAQTSPVTTPLIISTPALVESSPAAVVSTPAIVVQSSPPTVVSSPAIVEPPSTLAVVSSPAIAEPSSTPLVVPTSAIFESSPTSQFVVIPTPSAPVQSSEPLVVQSTDSGVVQPTDPVVVQPTDSGVVQSTEPSFVQSTDPGVVQPTDPGIVQPTDSGVIQPTDPGIIQPTDPGVIQPTDPGIIQPTDPGVVQSTDPGIVQPTDPSIVQPTDPGVVQPTPTPVPSDVSTPTPIQSDPVTPTPVQSDPVSSPVITPPPPTGTVTPSAGPASSEQPSSCEPSPITECTVDVFESTTLFVSGGSTQTSVTTSSSTACQTSTVCDAAGFTATTTIAEIVTTTAAEFTCDVDTCANNQCPLPTGSAKLRKEKRAIEEYEALYGHAKDGNGMQRFGKRYLKALSQKTKRVLQTVSNGDVYNIGVCNDQPTRELNWGFPNNPAITQWGEWPGNGAAWWMRGLVGCTGIIVTSSRGYWMVHITEPGFMANGDDNDPRTTIWNTALDNLQNGHTSTNAALDADTKAPGTLTGSQGILELTCDNDVRVWTMSPGTADDYDFDTDTDIPGEAIYPDKLRELLDTLVNNQGAPLNGARIMDNKVYQKTGSDLTSNGRMMVEFDPHGIEGGTEQPTYRVWAEDQNIGTWPDQGSPNKKRQACSNPAPPSTTQAPASTSTPAPPPAQTTPAGPSIDCSFAAHRVTDWYEGGAQRYRIAYSGPSPMADLSGSPPSSSKSLQDVAGYWWTQANADCAGVEQNMQNYWSSGDNSLVIDDSEVLGVAGSNVINCAVDAFVKNLKITAGCDV